MFDLFKKTIKNDKKDNSKIRFIVITGFAGSGKTTLGKELAKKLNYVYIDKDTATRQYTDYVLTQNNSGPYDRESEFYVNNLRNLEYEISFKLCDENLELGKSVILTIPFIGKIQNYDDFKNEIEKYISLGIDIRFIWILHNAELEKERIYNRNAIRDHNKMKDWDKYQSSIEKITPDERYGAFIFNNDIDINFDEAILEVIKWL